MSDNASIRSVPYLTLKVVKVMFFGFPSKPAEKCEQNLMPTMNPNLSEAITFALGRPTERTKKLEAQRT